MDVVASDSTDVSKEAVLTADHPQEMSFKFNRTKGVCLVMQTSKFQLNMPVYFVAPAGGIFFHFDHINDPVRLPRFRST